MLRSSKEVLGYKLRAKDRAAGKFHDMLFHDETWDAEYMVADIGSWLRDHLVLLPPALFEQPYRDDKSVTVALTRKQIENAPDLATDPPVSQQPGPLLVHGHPAGAPLTLSGPRHLRSMREVTAYQIQASDGPIGHVEDFIIDTDDWKIRYVVVDTRNWLPGKHVLVAPDWMDRIDWRNRVAHFDAKRERIKSCPPYDPSKPINIEYEERIYDYYGRLKYWVGA